MDIQTFAPTAMRSLAGAAIIVGAAVLYIAALLGMKLWGQFPSLALALIIAVCLAGAAALEFVALRGERLGLVYAAVLGVEVLVLAAVSHLALGEAFSARELAGIGMIVLGAALTWA